jgi:hypothetical protein
MMSLVRMSAHLRNRARGLIKMCINDLACIQQAPDLATRSVTTIEGLAVLPAELIASQSTPPPM